MSVNELTPYVQLASYTWLSELLFDLSEARRPYKEACLASCDFGPDTAGACDHTSDVMK